MQVQTQRSPRRFIDKIGLQFPSSYLRDNAFQNYRRGDVTIMRWGNTSRLMVHDESIEKTPVPAIAVIVEAAQLARNGVFIPIVASHLLTIESDIISGQISISCGLARLTALFEFAELELTLDLPGLSFPGMFDTKYFNRVHETTVYTKDFKRKRRGGQSRRAGESKGIQKSFLAVYRKDKQLGTQEPITRVEFRFDGKHRKDLCWWHLMLDKNHLFLALAPAINRNLERFNIEESVVWNPAALMVPGSALASLLDDIGLE